MPGGGDKIDDPGKMTFACERLGALGKCVTAGYKPWDEVSGSSLADYHQACVRTLRADYCGDGMPYTENGQPVNIYDQLGVQVDSEDWAAEAEWDASGARCVAQDNRSIETVPCFEQLATPDCGDPAHFDGTLLISETPPL